jgi:hypothetical protein
MASEASNTDFGAGIFKLCAKIINFVFTLIYNLKVQSVTSILKLFTFLYLPKCPNSLKLRKAHFSTLRNFSTYQVTKVLRTTS